MPQRKVIVLLQGEDVPVAFMNNLYKPVLGPIVPPSTASLALSTTCSCMSLVNVVSNNLVISIEGSVKRGWAMARATVAASAIVQGMLRERLGQNGYGNLYI